MRNLQNTSPFYPGRQDIITLECAASNFRTWLQSICLIQGRLFAKILSIFFILFLHHSGLLLMFVIRICSWRRKKQLNLFQFSLKFWRRALSKCFWCYCQWHSGRFTFNLYANLKTESLDSGSSVFEEAGQSQKINSGIFNIK